MDLVLGLSMTSHAVRWVLVEGMTGEGATTDRGTFDLTAEFEPDNLLNALPLDGVDNRINAIGVTWTNEAEDAASEVLQALTAREYDNVIAVSEVEAGDLLAAGIAAITDYDDVAVCIVEPDAAVVAVVNSEGVDVDRIARPLDGADAVELPSSVIATLELNEWQPDAIFVVGSSEDLDLILSTLDDATESPVFSAADADLALARGAALAAARAVDGLTPARRRMPSRTGALASVLVAAVVTFIVSLSVALGLGFTHDAAPEQPQAANGAEPATPAPPPTQEATKASNLRASLREALPVVAQTIAVAPPPPVYVPPAPVYEPPAPAAPAPPAPVYAPPPAPNYVPPVPQPRLRDRIIERIPIINRFHEPKYQYPPR